MFIEEDVVKEILKELDETKERCNYCSRKSIDCIRDLKEERNDLIDEANLLSIALDLACQKMHSAGVTVNNEIPPSWRIYRELFEEEAFNKYEYRKEHGERVPYETR